MSRSQLERFTDRLDPDEVTDVLGYANAETREAVLGTLDAERREKIDFLLSFDPESAAGLMNLDYVTVDRSRGFDEVAERVRRFEERTGRVPTIFVTDREEFLGELPGTALSVADPETERITDHLRETPSVRYDRADEEVLAVFRQNSERTVAVLDEDGDILGVIHARDLLQLIDEAAGETLYEFTGVAEEESVLDGAVVKIRRRYKWLILNLATAFMAAAVVGLFESTIAASPSSPPTCRSWPGWGNAGTQSMAVTVRGISLGQVSLSTGKRVIANEAIAGAANGLITGALVAGHRDRLLVRRVRDPPRRRYRRLDGREPRHRGVLRRPHTPHPRQARVRSGDLSDHLHHDRDRRVGLRRLPRTGPGGVDLSVLGGSLQPGQEPDRRVPSRPAS